MKSTLEEDRDLLAGCFSGDGEATETLVRRFSNLVYKAIQHTLIVKHVYFNKEDLEDFHNTVFLRLFERGCKKLKQYQGKNGCSLATWIKLITVRVVLDHLRKRDVDSIARRSAQIPLDEVYGLKGDECDGLALLEREEKGRLLREGIQNLSPRDRLFMKLHFDQGLPVAEIAAAMQITIENVYIVKHRAIQRLKAQVASATGKELKV
jgi:RNA polymerase sigma factor (sigma-70 family)